MQNISDASLYTDFNQLARLRADAAAPANSEKSEKATKEVAKQFESFFLQMMLKSMRDASITGNESVESDQTKFYQEMFDKQIALDLSSRNNGDGIGIASMLEKMITGNDHSSSMKLTEKENIELIRNQINSNTSSLQKLNRSEQE